MDTGTIIALVKVAVGAALLVLLVSAVIKGIKWGIGIYNTLVSYRQQVKSTWSGVDVQLQRRWDLIPNIVECVKGYAKHEHDTLQAVIAARQQAIDLAKVDAKQRAAAESMLSGVLRSLFSVSEKYPELKADKNFMALQQELAGTENSIGYARTGYNTAVTHSNNLVQMFPSSLIAKRYGFELAAFFEAPDEAKVTPKVGF